MDGQKTPHGRGAVCPKPQAGGFYSDSVEQERLHACKLGPIVLKKNARQKQRRQGHKYLTMTREERDDNVQTTVGVSKQQAITAVKAAVRPASLVCQDQLAQLPVLITAG
jgi:hypothetical protein